ncbi:MAG: glycerophosphodiester phosphodiesterase [Dehalococcoidia bacterium]
MDSPRGTSRLLPSRTGQRPVLIAHTGGNSLAQAAAAIERGADLVEIDLFVRGSAFEARHARSLHPLPVWLEGCRPAIAPRGRYGLVELLAFARGKDEVLLDLKSGGPRAAHLVRAAMDEAGGGIEVAASSQVWSTLRALAALCPEVDLYYSIDVRPQLDLFLSVMERDNLPAGVSCRHTQLSPPLVRKLHDRDLLVVAWTVDDEKRAIELATWGVDGITTHRPRELRAALFPGP